MTDEGPPDLQPPRTWMDAEVLERFPEHVAVQVGRDLELPLG
jgi:hypothetical protein